MAWQWFVFVVLATAEGAHLRTSVSDSPDPSPAATFVPVDENFAEANMAIHIAAQAALDADNAGQAATQAAMNAQSAVHAFEVAKFAKEDATKALADAEEKYNDQYMAAADADGMVAGAGLNVSDAQQVGDKLQKELDALNAIADKSRKEASKQDDVYEQAQEAKDDAVQAAQAAVAALNAAKNDVTFHQEAHESALKNVVDTTLEAENALDAVKTNATEFKSQAFDSAYHLIQGDLRDGADATLDGILERNPEIAYEDWSYSLHPVDSALGAGAVGAPGAAGANANPNGATINGADIDLNANNVVAHLLGQSDIAVSEWAKVKFDMATHHDMSARAVANVKHTVVDGALEEAMKSLSSET